MNKLLKSINMGYYILYVYEEITRDGKVCARFPSLEEAEEFLQEVEKRELRLYSQLREFLEELSF